MNDLVFLEPNKIGAEPFTTSKVICEFSGVSHKYIKKQITTHKPEFKSLGLLGAYATESTGGRPEEIYRLNEPQASFLMTLLKNTPVVVTFKLELVRQFYAMRTELQRRQIAKLDRKPIRESLTNGIKALPETPHKSMWYKHYTDLIYRVVTGMSAEQLRESRGAPPKATASDYMSAGEIEMVSVMENRVAVMLELGMDYQQVKSALRNLKITAYAG
jgi:phage regulator Rha-like protein